MNTQESSASGPSHESVEVGVAALVVLFGALAIVGSISAGIGWGAEGPRAGFFPFYIGVAIVISGAVNMWTALRPDCARRHLRRVEPAPSGAERRDPGHDLCRSRSGTSESTSRPPSSSAGSCDGSASIAGSTVAAVAIGMPLVVYFVFEKWFLVALPKGPIEQWLNL